MKQLRCRVAELGIGLKATRKEVAEGFGVLFRVLQSYRLSHVTLKSLARAAPQLGAVPEEPERLR